MSARLYTHETTRRPGRIIKRVMSIESQKSREPSLNLERIYQYRFRDVDQTARQAVWNEIAMYVHSVLGKPNVLLDPAAGRCEFLRGLPGVERWAIDLADHSLAEGDRDGIRFVIGDSLRVELPQSYFGGAFVSNFLEHLQSHEEIALLLTRLRDALEPGGRVAILGPNFKYCAREYFDCADHVLALTHISIEEHLFAAGFEVERVIPRFIPYSFRGILPPSPVLTRWFLRMPFVWRFFGKQFLVIGRKPE